MTVAVAVPAALLAVGAGMGVVVAKDRPAGIKQTAKAGLSTELTAQLRQAAWAESGRRASSPLKRKPCKGKDRKCKKPKPKAKLMTGALAEQKAEASARRAWSTDWKDIFWDDYGSYGCRRLSRSAVTCLAWVDWIAGGYEDSGTGSTYECEWWVTSRWIKKSGGSKRKKRVSYRLEVNDRRHAAVCDYY